MLALVIMDEYAQSDSAVVKNVLTGSMGAKRNPLLWLSRPPAKTRHAFFEELQIHKSILRGGWEWRLFSHIFLSQTIGMPKDDPATWKKVQPHLGITVQADFYEHEWQKAKKQLAADWKSSATST